MHAVDAPTPGPRPKNLGGPEFGTVRRCRAHGRAGRGRARDARPVRRLPVPSVVVRVKARNYATIGIKVHRRIKVHVVRAAAGGERPVHACTMCAGLAM